MVVTMLFRTREIVFMHLLTCYMLPTDLETVVLSHPPIKPLDAAAASRNCDRARIIYTMFISVSVVEPAMYLSSVELFWVNLKAGPSEANFTWYGHTTASCLHNLVHSNIK